MTSILKVNQIQTTAGGVPTAADLGLNVTGTVLQVVQAFKSDIWSSSSTSYVDVTGLSITITPSSANSKIYIAAYLGRVSNSGSSYYSNAWRFTRGSTAIGVGDAAGNRLLAGMNTHHYDGNYDGTGAMFYLDNPSTTSPVTYKVQGAGHGSGTVLLNYSESNYDVNLGYGSRTGSNLIAMEIAG